MENKQEEIERYLHNEMSEEEHAVFERQMEIDKQLKEEVLLQINIHNTFKDTSIKPHLDTYNQEAINALKNELRSDELIEVSNFIKKSTLQHKNKKKNLFKNFGKYAAAVVAFFFIAFVVKLTLKNPSYTVYNKYADWNNLPSLVEKSANNNNTLTQIEDLFLNKEYKKITTIIKEDTVDPYQLIYKGVSFVKLNQFVDAHNTFDSLINSNTLESSRGYWYKLLLYLKQDKKEDIKKTITIILKDKDNYNYQKVVEIYNLIDKR